MNQLESSASDLSFSDDFLHLLCHHLRSPSCTVQATLDILATTCNKHLDARGKRLMQHAAEANDRQFRLIDGLAAWAELGHRAPRPEDVPLQDCLDAALQRLRDSDADLLQNKVQAEGLPILNIDREQITELFHALLDNVVQHTQDGKLTITAQPQDAGTLVEFSDDGPGIPAELHESVFKPLHRHIPVDVADSGRSKSAAGMGLALARSIAEVHGGSLKISADSVTQGLQIRLWLPN